MIIRIITSSPYPKSHVDETKLTNEDIAEILEEIAYQVREGYRYDSADTPSLDTIQEKNGIGISWTLFYNKKSC